MFNDAEIKILKTCPRQQAGITCVTELGVSANPIKSLCLFQLLLFWGRPGTGTHGGARQAPASQPISQAQARPRETELTPRLPFRFPGRAGGVWCHSSLCSKQVLKPEMPECIRSSAAFRDET